MPLESGVRLGPYEIVSAIAGEGAEDFYKAADTEHNRTVAIKLLPPRFSTDAELHRRVKLDVQALSGLSHPHICALHEIRKENDTDFLVMEYLEGETLAQRLTRGALPLDQAVKVGLAIADALTRAHGAGLVHRNLRPSNIVLATEGAKLLGFGLEPHSNPPTPEPGSDVRSKATLPDLSDDVVRYMAPEQINGTEADQRSDLFALGAILYEMVTGQKAFEGRNRPMLIAAIAALDPYPLSKTQPDSPPMLDHIVERCLEKDPDNRWQTAHDMLVQLKWVSEGGAIRLAVARAQQKRERRVLAVLAVATLLVTVVVAQGMSYLGNSTKEEVLQFRVPVTGISSSDISISPDGKLLALVAKPNVAEPSWLFVRPVGATEFRKLTGTEEASQPFWSPDSRAIGFIAGGKLKRVDAMGGAPKELGEAAGFMGGTWSSDRVILFGSPKGLFRVSDEGGKPELLTTIDKQEAGHYWPSFLDAQHYVYLKWSADAAAREVFTGTLGSKDTTKFMTADSNVVFAGNGHVLFHRDATLFAQQFDAKRFTPTGEPQHIADKVEFTPANGHGNFAASQNGSLIYFQSGGIASGALVTRSGVVLGNDVQFAWVDRRGKQLGLVGPQGRFGEIDATQDGKLVVMSRQEVTGPNSDVWTLDWQRSAWYRLTQNPSDSFNPVFSPDGERIAFTTFRKGNADIYIKNANGSNEETPLVESAANEYVEDWSKNDQYILYKSGDNSDIYAMPLSGEKKPIPAVLGPFQKDEPQLSYDGKWLAYTTNQTGTFQVYVKSFPAGDQIIPISTNGGGQPRWRKDGRELFYRINSQPMVVDITPGAKLIASAPRALFPPVVNGSADRDPTGHYWVVSPDGQRFLMRVALGQGNRGGIPFNTLSATPIGAVGAPPGAQQGFVSGALTVIRNWPGGLQEGQR